MKLTTYLQQTGLELKAYFEDATGAASAPQTVHWRVTCPDDGSVIQDWAEVTADLATDDGGNYVEIDVPGSLNAMTSSKERESRRITIVADKDLTGEYGEDVDYAIKRGGR